MTPHAAPDASPTASCRDAAARLKQVRRLLLDPRPEVLDDCQTELSGVTIALTALVSSGLDGAGLDLRTSLSDIKTIAAVLQHQIQHASNLCLGWNQLWLGTGYTDQGLPVIATGGSTRSFEV
jgi:signal transduction histidine kinase